MSKDSKNNHLNDYYAAFIEQYILADLMAKRKLSHTEIFNEYFLLKQGLNDAAKEIGYSHFWCDSKYNQTYINAIKSSIETKYPKYMQYIKKFEMKHR